MKLKIKSKFLGILTIMVSLILVVVSILAYTSLNSKNYIKNITPPSSDQYTLTKFDLFNPTYTIVYGNCDDNRTEIGYLVIPLQRTGLFSFNTTKGIPGKTDCENYQQLQDSVKKINLADPSQNPNPDKFKTEGVATSGNINGSNFLSQTIEERYYNPPKVNSRNDISVQDFKKLKKGMNFDQSKVIVGDGDLGFGDGGVTKTNGEMQFTINKDNVNFISIGWSKHPDLYDDAILQNAFIVYKDRTVEEISLESLPGFVPYVRPQQSSSRSSYSEDPDYRPGPNPVTGGYGTPGNPIK